MQKTKTSIYSLVHKSRALIVWNLPNVDFNLCEHTDIAPEQTVCPVCKMTRVNLGSEKNYNDFLVNVFSLANSVPNDFIFVSKHIIPQAIKQRDYFMLRRKFKPFHTFSSHLNPNQHLIHFSNDYTNNRNVMVPADLFDLLKSLTDRDTAFFGFKPSEVKVFTNYLKKPKKG